MTWPIDLAEELRELDEEPETIGEYTTLIQAQRSYKSALLTPGVLKALFDMMLPPLAKDKKSAISTTAVSVLF
jgi:replication fork protection complex subunit Tof1/Swi1